ncbi:esterase [Arthrobacter sp. PAMC25564]|uniref:alpha/beta hydrolase n=1 Tax=Arthrobacter sp. PAMC25564 TaxID=2565366 RepID=UPI0010A20319|nr:alpha/beta hydrolase-fold protein [Arthrobacter sp. PAMC25564]QCB97032.1 esterase [Arthrobacter sp. PAMC25564]
MDFIEDIRLVDGPVLWIAWFAGAAGMAYLLWRSGRRHSVSASAVVLAAALMLSAALVAGIHLLLIYVLSVFPEELPWETLVWSVPAVSGLLLWLLRLHGIWGRKPFLASIPHAPRPVVHRLRSTAAATGALLGVVALSAVQINVYFGLNQTVSDLTGTAVARIQPLEAGLERPAGAPTAVGLAGWNAPGELPEGAVRRAEIPGTSSGFHSREAYLYLPPAYQSSPRPALPVLVLFSGQPGGPADWLSGGALRGRLDRFASAHNGVAPVVVVVDPNGSATGNTLCMDSRIAQADTFLARDVPAWINRTLDVDPDPRQWAVGGFSYGATCAVQMVTRHPEVYNAALAFSSEKEPALAKERDKTIQASFGGDTAAFERQTPLQLMKEHSFAGSAIYFGAGERDPEFIGYMDLLSAAARNSGFAVETRRIPNAGHSWETASKGLPGGLDFLAGRWGIQP